MSLVSRLDGPPAPITRAEPARALHAALWRLWRAVRPAPGVSRRLLARWHAMRTTVMTGSAFTLLSAAAWTLAVPAGLAAGGLSLLILEVLADDEGDG